MNSWVVYNIQKFYSVSRNGDFNCAYSYNLSGLKILVVHSMYYR